MNYKVTRVMARLNFIVKFHDELLNDNYYLFLRSSKLWSDMNFINTRVFALENQEHWFISKDVDKESEARLKENLKQEISSLNEEKAKELVLAELDKVFGIRDFKGELLQETISYIEESKRAGDLTYYLHFFYRVTELPQLQRLIGLENIELVSENLLSQFSKEDFKLHENYQLSKIIQKFFSSSLWEKEREFSILPQKTTKKKRIAVLFSDLKEFGKLVQQYETEYPDFTKELIKKYQHECSYFIKANGGYVVQTAGDAFMAIFDFSKKEENLEEDLFSVLKAAIGIISIPEILVNNKKITVVTRIGINIADVEEGYIGAPDLREYTVFGKDVNIASRLEKKVDELFKEIPDFAGGVLCNIDKLKKSLTHDVKENIETLFQKLFTEIKNAPDWLQESLVNSLKQKEELISTLPVFYEIKNKIQNYFKDLEHKNTSKLVFNPELIQVQTKEGNTHCIFIYKISENVYKSV